MKINGKRAAAAVLIILMTAGLLSGCQGKKKTETAVQATRVRTQSAEKGTLEVTGSYIGTMAPHNSVDVTPLVAGTVKKVNVKVGDKVSEGDILCQFDDKAASLQLQSAEDAVNSAKAGKEAAKDQIDAARKQARTSITSLEGQLKTLKEQKKTQEDQLEQVRQSVDALKQGQDAAQETYIASKNVYDRAQMLYLQYKHFLEKNPDCTTTAGLVEASIPDVSIPVEPVITSIEGGTSENEFIIEFPDNDSNGENEEFLEKQQTAAQLAEDLTEVPLTVEYLTDFGIDSLKDKMEQAEDAASKASTAYTQSLSTITQLENGIKQIKTQIRTLEDNIDAAEDAAKKTGGNTKAYDAQIKAAQTGVESAQYQKDLYTVRSPIDGIVEAVNVTENQASGQGMPAFKISDKELMEVSFYVPEDVRDYVREGDRVTVEAGSGEVKGRISSISTAVDQQRGLFKIDAQITSPGDKNLSTNTSVSLTLVTNSVKDKILIPFDSVYYDDDQAYVFVVENDRAVRRDVTAGPYNNDTIAILDGLIEGDEVIITWGAGLKDGAIVQVIEQENDNSSSGTGTDSQKK